MRGPRDSDDLVPLHEPFETALRGFNRQQVLEHIDSLDGRIAIVAADRDAALAQVAELSKALDHLRSESELLVHLRREAEKATTEVERILTMPMVEASVRIQRILQLAEEEAGELRARAETEIVARRARADQHIAELQTRAEDQITGLRASASREARSLLEHARRQCEQLEAESAARRQTAEQDAARAIAEREAEAESRIQQRELRGLATLYLMLQVMDAHLTSRVRALDHDEAALRELREQLAADGTALQTLRTEVTSAVAATHQLMAEALSQLRGITTEQMSTGQDPAGQPEVPAPRGDHGGKVYLLNTNSTDDRRLPRTPH